MRSVSATIVSAVMGIGLAAALPDAQVALHGQYADADIAYGAALYASKALIGSGRLWITGVQTLRDLPLLVYTPPYQMLQQAKWFQALLSSATIGLETNSTHALLAAARAGTGIAVLPRFVARQDDELIAVSDSVADHDVWLITHPEFSRDPKVRATADFLKRIAVGPNGLS